MDDLYILGFDFDLVEDSLSFESLDFALDTPGLGMFFFSNMAIFDRSNCID